MIEEENINLKYIEATNLYNIGCLNLAKNLFAQLIIKDPSRWEFWFSIAAIHQLEKNYVNSINSYETASILNPSDARIYFHLAECFLSINDKKNAITALNIAKKYCADTILKDKILILLEQNKNN